jgi:hypothetical protein
MLPINYLTNQASESLSTPQQSADPLQLPMISGSNVMNPQRISFVDSSIADAATVIAGLQSDVKVLLDSTQDGIAQITSVLKNYTNLAGIDIISHGGIAQINLGNSSLIATSLPDYASDLAAWRSALAPGADILLYGCNVAEGELGQSFVNQLGSLTGADVAASIDITGHAAKGGDWLLEYATGTIAADTSLTDSLRDSYQGILPSLFTTQTPAVTNATDGGSDYELGMEFRTATTGTIDAIRYYKAPSETGTHVGRIWSSTGQLLASVTFTNETGSGWQQQALSAPLTIQANTTYVVSVNANSHFAITNNGIATTLTNGGISAVADGSNGTYSLDPGQFPTESLNNNYFRDIVFTPTPANSNNVPGTVNLTGTAAQNQTLSATVTDPDGLGGATIGYQWQQSSNGTTWTNISGANNQTFALNQTQVGQQVRINATYTDVLGTQENIFSTPTATIANINDPGTVAISGTTAVDNILSATVTDLDGLSGVTINYQWQQSSNGTTWTNISGATNQTLSLTNGLVGQRVRVNATYTDVLTGSESISSNTSAVITAVSPSQTLFTTQTPAITNATDGGSDYELGMEFRTATTGTIDAIRYYKAPSETGTHVGRIWSSTGQLLASVTFTNETGSGWQQQALSAPLEIQANITYVVSVNANSHFAITNNGIATTLTNGGISAVADGSNGTYDLDPGQFPTQSLNNNYFRDIVFTPTPANSNNVPGTVNLTGTAAQNQTLSATVNDPDGLGGATIGYQWQQSSNGTTWANISGATNQTFALNQAQVGQQVRINATYTDVLGTQENIFSTPTAAIVNINDPGTVAISGTTAVDSILSATVTDLDGLTGVTIGYQWQQSSNGTTWTNISGATNQTLSLTSTLLGQRVRVNATYTDALTGSESISSNASAVITAVSPSQTLFTTQTPTITNATDGTGSNGDYELGMEFRTATPGTINAIRYYKAPSETGTHVGRIWSSTGQLLASVTFTNETGSGWQQQALSAPLTIQANTTYVVSVNANSHFAFTSNGIATTITNEDISAVADGSNGTYDLDPGQFPTQSVNNNYFRDIVFTPAPANPNNVPGTVNLTGTAAQNQTLTANVTDLDGLTGVAIGYQWQQSSNGSTWTNISGATNQTFALNQAQVGQQVRINATYTDVLGTRENLFSTPTAAIANINDPGTVAISGTTAVDSILSATVTDLDGLTGVTIGYQWQQSSNGTTWTNISGATNQTLSLTSTLLGQRVRVNATYTDALTGSESISSNASAVITAVSPSQTLFTTQTPTITNATDGTGSNGDYELGMEFRTATPGTINAIRYYKAPSETGTHVGRIWSSTGQLLASVTFTNETGSGWQQQALSAPLTIQANTTYVVSVNANSHFAFTSNGIATTITNEDISAVADGSNGTYDLDPGQFPTQSVNNNYFRDIVFTPAPANPNNVPGTVNLTGTAAQNQTLSATVTDPDGLGGATISYQWQQLIGGTWTNISGAVSSTIALTQAQVGQQLRLNATYIDALGTRERIFSNPTTIANVNDPGSVILKGSATVGASLDRTVFDIDGVTGVNINYQWQQLVNNVWTNIAGAATSSLALTTALVGQQVRILANYIDSLGSSENVASAGVTVAAQNQIVIENQKTGTTDWQITNLANNNEVAAYGDATSINKGEALNLKVSLAQAGQYQIDVYRLGYYGGAGGRLVTSATGLNGVTQAGPTVTNTSTNLIEYLWNTSYTVQTGTDWTTGLYLAKITVNSNGEQTYVPFVVRDDNRPADLGFQDAVSTAQAYNNYGGYSTYNANSIEGQRAYQVSFDRPYAASSLGLTNTDGFNSNTMLTWEYNMTRWLESQGYDVAYYTNIDASINPLQLYSHKTFLSVGHDEYWSPEQRNNVEAARDRGINLAFFSANTAYWQVRYEPSSTGQANRVMTVYKDTSSIGVGTDLDPIAQTNPVAATTLFRGPRVNRPENALLGVGYIGDTGTIYGGFDFIVSNASDPYYANTGLQNGDRLTGLVGYEWDGLLNNGLAPAGLVVLSQSPVSSSGLLELGLLPPGTNQTISNSVRYTAASGAKVFSTGSVQWAWGLDSSGVTNPREDIRVQQITVNVLADMGAKPKTPSSGIIIP